MSYWKRSTQNTLSGIEIPSGLVIFWKFVLTPYELKTRWWEVLKVFFCFFNLSSICDAWKTSSALHRMFHDFVSINQSSH